MENKDKLKEHIKKITYEIISEGQIKELLNTIIGPEKRERIVNYILNKTQEYTKEQLATMDISKLYGIFSQFKDKVNEDNVTGNCGCEYSTPKAFKKDRLKEAIDKITSKMLLEEGTYSQFKKDIKFRTKSEQLHKAIREVKHKINEINRLVEYTSRMKYELSEGEDGLKYWKATQRAVGQISEAVTQLSNKLKNLNQ